MRTADSDHRCRREESDSGESPATASASCGLRWHGNSLAHMTGCHRAAVIARHPALIARHRAAACVSALTALVALVALVACGTAAPARPSPPPQIVNSSPVPGRAPSATDWPTYDHDAGRSAAAAGVPSPGTLRIAWRRSLDGAVYAQPLVISGLVVAATEGGSIYALNAQSGTVVWRRHIAAPVPLSDLPCGNIDPLGITGTPVYDPASGLVFAVAETTGGTHLLAGVEPRDGRGEGAARNRTAARHPDRDAAAARADPLRGQGIHRVRRPERRLRRLRRRGGVRGHQRPWRGGLLLRADKQGGWDMGDRRSRGRG